MTIENILLKKALSDELAHFYLIETSLSAEKSGEVLYDFCHNFIRKYFHEIEKQTHPVNSLMDHPDVLVVTGIEEKKDYTVEDAVLMEKFFMWKAVQSQRKFVVIPEAHRLSETLANKWLKLLEEPPVTATIFLLNPRRIKLLPTIQSRALAIRIPHKRQRHVDHEWIEFLAAMKEMRLSKFLETYSKGDRSITFWMDELLNWETEQLTGTENKSELERVLKLIEEMNTFNQPAATKWTFLFHHLKEHVLPRLGLS
jgi:DNA polymerase III delta prime subunit